MSPRPPFRLRRGERFPPGAHTMRRGVNFSVFSRHATRAWLVLYEHAVAIEPLQVIELDPEVNRTFFFWHVFVVGACPGLHYTWRMDGPRDEEQGLRFDPTRELLDPWARIVSDALWDRRRAIEAAGTRSNAIRAVVPPRDHYDWEGDRPLDKPLKDAVIYELHVGGFTRHPTSGVSNPGTFLGVIDKIPYLEALGVTHVELLPVTAYDAQDVPEPVAQRGGSNYWGYSPYGFFAPHPGYAVGDACGEFREMIKALHRAGIGVILDMVLNHTAEGDETGPVISFKGLGNEFFYHLDPNDKRRYRDFSGCGNTVNCNHPLVARFLLQCLEFWVREMHVDGFRIDLASVLSRGEDGEPMHHAPVLWSIEFSEVLARTVLIAEAWDAGGLYQVGDFPGFRWAEWNGRYRDVARRFLRGDAGLAGELATRIAGSSDLYEPAGRTPANGINFVTCHDGFTLNDLVSYDEKHNQANGENNRDGSDENFSWNTGVEGPTGDAAIRRLRAQRARNFMALLMLSQGVPMILAGDEVLRTQGGNNNAYCQDNDVSWFDWSLLEKHADMLRFTREMIALRKRHASLRRDRFIAAEPRRGRGPELVWHGEDTDPPDWHDPEAGLLRFTLAGIARGEPPLHVMINASGAAIEVPLPPRVAWCRVADTSLEPPDDVTPREALQVLDAQRYTLAPLALAVFEGACAEVP